MKRLLSALLLCASPAFAQANGWQEIQNGWGEIQTPPGYATIPAPAICTVAGQVGVFLGSPLALGCSTLSFNTATGTLSTTRVIVGNGTATAPSVVFTSDQDTGWYSQADGYHAFSTNGTTRFSLGVNGFGMMSNGTIYWSSSTIGAASDLFLSRGAAATLQLGAANAASPVGQRLQSQGAATGTDIASADLTVGPGPMTGTGLTSAAGRNGTLRFKTYVPGATGTTASTTSADRYVIKSTPVTLTESSATPVMDYAVAAGSVAGGTVWYTIRADDGTNFQSLRGQLQWSAVNKAGTLTASVSLVGTETVAVSGGGTLTNTATISTGAGIITINLNAVSSLTQTTLHAWITSQSDGTGAVTTK